MADARWTRVCDLFEQVADLSDDARTARLDEVCGDDRALRDEVEAMIEADQRSERFLDVPATESVYAVGATVDDLPEGTQLGSYRVVEEIGAGGMGRVYRARRSDDAFDRDVAIKVVKRGMDTDEVLERFQLERRMLAAFEHPGIARLYDAGVTDDGRSYLVMELVDGCPIDTWCAERNLDVAARIRLFIEVCDAVDAAHRSLVVHRDLKPSNVLVDRSGGVRLVDFGIAKMFEPGHTFTQTGASRRFTPDYASPEQVRGEPVTTSTDVYALGVMLYELLTGDRPYRAESSSPAALERAVCETIPRRPSTRMHDERGRRRLQGDLDAIVMTALHKDVRRRYLSVAALTSDLRRHLAHEPIAARPDDRWYRTTRFVRRHRVLTTAAALLIVLTALWITTLTVARTRAERQAARAETIRDFIVEMIRAPDPGQLGQDVRVADVLDAAARDLETRFGDDPVVRGELERALAATWYGLGLHERSEGHYAGAVAQLEQAFGRNSIEALSTLSDHGKVLADLGRLDEAEAALRRALAGKRDVLGARDESTLVTMNNLAGVYRRRGDLAEAEALYAETLAIREAEFGPLDPSLLVSRHNLASLRYELGRVDEAIADGQAVVEGCEREFGPDDPRTLITMESLISMLSDAGRLDEAEALAMVSVERHRRVLPEQHPDLAYTLNNLAMIERDRGRHDDALRTLQSGQAIVHDLQRRPMIWFIITSNIGQVLNELGRATEAEGLLREATAAEFVHLESDARLQTSVGLTLAQSLAAQGRLDEAHAVLDERHARALQRFGADSNEVRAIDETRQNIASPGSTEPGRQP